MASREMKGSDLSDSDNDHYVNLTWTISFCIIFHVVMICWSIRTVTSHRSIMPGLLILLIQCLMKSHEIAKTLPTLPSYVNIYVFNAIQFISHAFCVLFFLKYFEK